MHVTAKGQIDGFVIVPIQFSPLLQILLRVVGVQLCQLCTKYRSGISVVAALRPFTAYACMLVLLMYSFPPDYLGTSWNVAISPVPAAIISPSGRSRFLAYSLRFPNPALNRKGV